MKKGQVFLWVVGSGCLALVIGFVIFVVQMNNVNTQYTQPGIADYRNRKYSKAIQELNISIQRNGADRAAFWYLGLSLKKNRGLCWRTPRFPGRENLRSQVQVS